MKSLKPILNLFFLTVIAFILATPVGLSPLLVFFILLFLQFIPMPKGIAFMAVTKEIWESDIIGNLFKDNSFAARAFNGDQYVVAGKIVHIPNAGVPSPSQKNVTVFPITAVKRTDDEVLYALDNYYQPPKFVEKVEQYELSYDKRQSIMGEQESQLIDDAMNGLLWRWGWIGLNIGTNPISVIPTTGVATGSDLIAGATGNRATFTKDAFAAAKKAMDNANIPPKGRIALLTANHHQQFIDALSDTAQTNFYRSADMQNGIIGKWLGFDVMMRSSVQRWRTVGGVLVPIDELDPAFAASDKTGDSAASLFYHDVSVERARGTVNVFDDNGRPEYYGDVFSMNLRLGGRTRRPAGVYAVVEDVAA